MLLKEFGGVNAFPICIDTTDPDEFVRTVEVIAPGFGGIHLEDIKAPECFYIEDKLKEKLNIPVYHDDQHGTAVAVLAGLLNALKLVGKKSGGCANSHQWSRSFGDCHRQAIACCRSGAYGSLRYEWCPGRRRHLSQ